MGPAVAALRLRGSVLRPARAPSDGGIRGRRDRHDRGGGRAVAGDPWGALAGADARRGPGAVPRGAGGVAARTRRAWCRRRVDGRRAHARWGRSAVVLGGAGAGGVRVVVDPRGGLRSGDARARSGCLADPRRFGNCHWAELHREHGWRSPGTFGRARLRVAAYNEGVPARFRVRRRWLGRSFTGCPVRAGERGCSAVGSAPPWHGGGQGFESPQLHQ
jgi:hypothetical protein